MNRCKLLSLESKQSIHSHATNIGLAPSWDMYSVVIDMKCLWPQTLSLRTF